MRSLEVEGLCCPVCQAKEICFLCSYWAPPVQMQEGEVVLKQQVWSPAFPGYSGGSVGSFAGPPGCVFPFTRPQAMTCRK